MLTQLLWLKFAKFVAVVLLGVGTAGALRDTTLLERQRSVYAVAAPAFVLVGTAGFGLARLTNVSLGAPWIAGALLLSLGWLQLLFWSVEREGRRSPLVRSLAWTALTGALALMIFRPAPNEAPLAEANPVEVSR